MLQEDSIFTQTKNIVLDQIEEGEFILDNNPTSLEFQQVQTSYKSLISSLKNETSRKELAKPSNEAFLEQLESSNTLLPKIHGTTLGTMDSEFIALNSNVCAERIRTLRHSQTQIIEPKDLKLLFLRFPSLNENVLKEKAMRYWRGIQCPQHLLGLFADPTSQLLQERTKHNIRATTATKSTAEIKSPVTSKMGKMVEGDDVTTLNITKIFQLILDETSTNPIIPLSKIICNPSSFAKTVENLFYVSFLVKDGKISIKDLGNGDYGINIRDEESSSLIEDEENKNQKIIPISFSIYRNWINQYFRPSS